MALGTKFYYENIIDQSRIQFFDDDVLQTEWIAHNGDVPVLEIGSSPGATVYRKEYISAVRNVKNWVDGTYRSGINLAIDRPMSLFKTEVKQNNNYIKFEFAVKDIYNVEYALRETSYDKAVDQVAMAERISGATIYWADYIEYLKLQDCYVALINTWFQNSIN